MVEWIKDEKRGHDAGASIFFALIFGEKALGLWSYEKLYGEPEWGATGRAVYERTYQRTKQDGTQENWGDTVGRVVNGNTSLVPDRFIEAGERDKLFELIYNFKVLPAGRHLWVSGVPGRQFTMNCWVSGWEEKMSDHYGFTFDQLMQGGGVGANYSNRYVDKFSHITNNLDLHIVCDKSHADYWELPEIISDKYSSDWDGAIRIEDSREGWVDALERVIDLHFEDSEQTLILDISLIRERGRKIKGFGGKASGPYALANMLQRVNELMNNNIFKQLTSLDHMIIDHEIARCVVAGNVRRSARMSVKSWKDKDIFDFINCKKDHMNHWTTNISVEIDDDFFKALKSHDQLAKDVYTEVVSGMLTDGEPGFWNYSYANDGEINEVICCNPCAEINLRSKEPCCLGHVNISAFSNDFEASKEAFRLMTRFLIRATYCDFSSEESKKVVEENRRIGVGFFGFQSWLVKNGIRFSDSHRDRYVRKTLRDWKAVVDKEKRRYAFQLRIPEPIKATTIAPTGSIAKLPGETEGIHPIYGKYFIRRIRFADNDPALKEYENDNYEIEDDLNTSHTKIVSFICKDQLLDQGVDEEFVEQANEISLSDMLAVQAMVQECYADNSISFTVNIEPDTITVSEAERTIIHYLPYLKGSTIMIDGSRPQAPYERITKEQYEMSEISKMVDSGYDIECSTASCPIR